MVTITDDEIDNIINRDGEVLIYYGSKKCENCKQFVQAVKRMDDIELNLYYLDEEDNQCSNFIDEYNLYTTPTLIIFIDGEVVERYENGDAFDRLATYYNNKLE